MSGCPQVFETCTAVSKTVVCTPDPPARIACAVCGVSVRVTMASVFDPVQAGPTVNVPVLGHAMVIWPAGEDGVQQCRTRPEAANSATAGLMSIAGGCQIVMS